MKIHNMFIFGGAIIVIAGILNSIGLVKMLSPGSSQLYILSGIIMTGIGFIISKMEE